MRSLLGSGGGLKSTTSIEYLSGQTDLVWKSWGDSTFWIVFHSKSHQTHLLDEVSAAVLRSICNGSWSFELVASDIVRKFELEADARQDALNFAASVVPRLVQLGLVRGSQS